MFTDKKRKQYCDVLGIPGDADEEKIKRAYKRLALEHHPDRPNNKGKEEESRFKFMKITEAYEKLTNSNNTLNMLKGVFKSTEIHSSLEHFFLYYWKFLKLFQYFSCRPWRRFNQIDRFIHYFYFF